MSDRRAVKVQIDQTTTAVVYHALFQLGGVDIT
jgi:hypothetical protein